MGGGPKPNSNVPIVDVPKWLRRGGRVSGLIGTIWVFLEGVPKVKIFFIKKKFDFQMI